MEKDKELKQIDQFTGTEKYTNVMGINCTDGVVYVMENGYSWVVTDAAVILKMKLLMHGFVTVELKLNPDKTARILYTDGDGQELYEQQYEYTDAVKEFKMYYIDNVLMLCNEY